MLKVIDMRNKIDPVYDSEEGEKFSGTLQQHCTATGRPCMQPCACVACSLHPFKILDCIDGKSL